MSADIFDLVGQAGFATDLNKSLTEANNKMNLFSSASRTQSKFANEIAVSYEKSSEHLNKMLNATNQINQSMIMFVQNINSFVNNPGMNSFFSSFFQYIDNATNRYKKVVEVNEELVEAAEKSQTSSQKSQESLNKAAEQEKKYAKTQASHARKHIENLGKLKKSANEFKNAEQEFAEAVDVSKLATSSWTSKFKSVISGGFALVKMLGSLLGTATTWVKTVFTLPFMVLENVVKAGNALRTDIITVIEQAAQETKEFFDSLSNVGQGIRKMTSMGKGMLIEFENYNSEAVKLFGEGASGISNMIKETSNSIKAMGHYSEMFGHTITKNKTSLFHFTRIKKAIGLEDDQLAYYAQDAGVNLISLNDRLTTMALLTKDVSSQYDVDMKRLGKNFNILRKDIALYGHLSDEELLKTTARLTQMKISVEDASSVFKKFNTFEDAANSVAMLSQTFGMNLDAMDIIQAKNPEDIINMFRNSMIATGRTFDELNRFEKEILADQTGMSQEGLKALMTLRDKGLTHQEAVDAMKDQTPEAKQMKAIKELNTSINMLQKVMNFTSPFDAFLKGLGKNAAASSEARKAFMSLSNTYQMIHDWAIKLDGETINGLMEPVILIVDIMRNILDSPGFKGGLTSLVKSFGNVAMNLFGVTDSEKIYAVLEQNLTGMTSTQKDMFTGDLKEIENDIQSTSVKDLFYKYRNNKKFQSNPDRFLAFMKEFRAKSLADPKVKAEFDQLMTNFRNKYNMGSFNRKIKDNEGVPKTINDFKDALEDILKGNSGNFEKFFNISGATLGAIIKGSSILLTSGINILNQLIDDISPSSFTKTSKGKTILEQFFNWEPGTLSDLASSVGDSLGELFSRTGKLAFIGAWITENFMSVLADVGQFFWMTLKSAGRELFPDMFGKEESLDEIMSKTERGIKGYNIGKSKAMDSKYIDLDTKSGKQHFASKVIGLSKSAAKEGGPLQHQVDAIKRRGYEGTASQKDYERLTMIEGYLDTVSSSESNRNKFGLQEGSKDIFGNEKRIEENKKLFDNYLIRKLRGPQNRLYKDIMLLNDDANNRGSMDNFLTGTGHYSFGNQALGAAQEFISGTPAYINKQILKMVNDSDFKLNKGTAYHKLFGKYMSIIDKSRNNPNKQNPILDEDVIGSGFNTEAYAYKTLGYQFKNLPEVLRDQLSYYKNIKDKTNDSGQVVTADDFSLHTFSNLFAAKPGGVIDTIFSGIYGLSSEAAATSANVNSMYGDNSINTVNKKLTTEKATQMCNRLKEYKEEAKNPKEVDMTFDITDEIADILGISLVKRGLLDKLCRPDYMSASTTRLNPSASTAGNLQPGRQGIVSGRDYLYYDNA